MQRSDARREDGAVRDGGPGTAARRSRRQSEPAGPGGCDRTVLRRMSGCCSHSGCIRRKHDAARATKKRSDEGRCHYRPVVTLTHSAWLVNRSLPVTQLRLRRPPKPTPATRTTEEGRAPWAPWPPTSGPLRGSHRPRRPHRRTPPAGHQEPGHRPSGESRH